MMRLNLDAKMTKFVRLQPVAVAPVLVDIEDMISEAVKEFASGWRRRTLPVTPSTSAASH